MGALTRDFDSGADAPTVEKADRPEFLTPEPVAFLLPTDTCHGRRLPEDLPGIELAGEGMTLWHLCYTLPTRHSSSDPWMNEPPERLSVEVATLVSERLLFVAPIPARTPSWTVSLLVALPTGLAPAFQGRLHYPSHGDLELVARSNRNETLTVQGEMRTWRVLRSLSQDEYPPSRACDRPTALRPTGAFFLPEDMCPGHTCPLLSGLSCQNLSPR